MLFKQSVINYVSNKTEKKKEMIEFKILQQKPYILRENLRYEGLDELNQIVICDPWNANLLILLNKFKRFRKTVISLLLVEIHIKEIGYRSFDK